MLLFFILMKSLWSFVTLLDFVWKSIFGLVAVLYSSMPMRWPKLRGAGFIVWSGKQFAGHRVQKQRLKPAMNQHSEEVRAAQRGLTLKIQPLKNVMGLEWKPEWKQNSQKNASLGLELCWDEQIFHGLTSCHFLLAFAFCNFTWQKSKCSWTQPHILLFLDSHIGKSFRREGPDSYESSIIWPKWLVAIVFL